MFTLILGAASAGKSRYAENLAVKLCAGPLLYIATMIPVGEGDTGAARVRRHREQRAHLGFTTIEQPLNLEGIAIDTASTVLLEDVSNLVANCLFADKAPGAPPPLADVLTLLDRCQHLVAVSYYGLEPAADYSSETNNYIRELNRVNDALSATADAVVLLREGTPISLKGALPL